VSNADVIDDNELESGRDLIEVQSRHLLGGAEETYENLIQDIRCSGRDSNRAPPE
jgi:hypothetical protein